MADIDQREFRNALGRFATGVTIITAVDSEKKPIGLTANSFSSVSLDPALVLFCLDRRATNFDTFQQGTGFVINVLSDQQTDLSNRFAKSDPDKFTDVFYETWDTGAPVLPDCLANMECIAGSIIDAGDHVIVVGEVQRFSYLADDPRPLMYFSGSYREIDPA